MKHTLLHTASVPLLVVALVLIPGGAVRAPEEAKEGEPASIPHVHVCLTQDPDTAVPPGGRVTFSAQMTNLGSAASNVTTLLLLVDPRLAVVDVQSFDGSVYVHELTASYVDVHFHIVDPGDEPLIRIVARVRDAATADSPITARALASWGDTRSHDHTWSNLVQLAVGPAVDRGTHGLRPAIEVVPREVQVSSTPLVVRAAVFAQDEPVSAWLRGAHGRVLPLGTPTATAEGLVTLAVPTAGLPGGTYTLVLHGCDTGVEAVGDFTVR